MKLEFWAKNKMEEGTGDQIQRGLKSSVFRKMLKMLMNLRMYLRLQSNQIKIRNRICNFKMRIF